MISKRYWYDRNKGGLQEQKDGENYRKLYWGKLHLALFPFLFFLSHVLNSSVYYYREEQLR